MIKTALLFLVVLFISCEPEVVVDYDREAKHRLIFVGNSYTYYNQLNRMVDSAVAHLEQETVFSARIAKPGKTSHNHYEDLTDHTDIYRVFIRDAYKGKRWDLLVLQENSQIPGLLGIYTSRMKDLHFHLGKSAKKTMLMMTWAYVHGYPEQEQKLYPNYEEMQKRLEAGTRVLAKEMTENGNQVTVIPAGLAFNIVYDDLKKEGKDPLAENSLFRQLYLADGRHPSHAGTYLAACIIAAQYTQKSVAGMEHHPRLMDPKFAKYLREVADRVVKSEKNLSLLN